MNPVKPETSTLETAANIQNWLTAQIADQLGYEPDDIETDSPLDTFGLDSVQVLRIAHNAQETFGVQLSPVLLQQHPTIASLAQRLAEDVDAADSEFTEI
jgi:acyl carrier protein